jgi:hypothetical protein
VYSGALVGKQRVSDTEHESFHIPALRILQRVMSIPVLRVANPPSLTAADDSLRVNTVGVVMAHGNKRYYVV